MVQTTKLDSNAGDPAFVGSPHDDHLFHSMNPSYDQSFPIRTSRQYHLANGGQPIPGSEPQLRRKTPGGTIDAGLGAFPNKPSPDEPPLKQVVLPGSSSVPSVHPLNGMSQLSQGYGLRSLDSSHMHAGASWSFNSPVPHNPGMLNYPDANYQFCQPPQQMGGNAFPSIYQPVIRANEYNVRAFCPPPPSFAWGMPFGQSNWQPGLASGWDTQQNGSSASYYSHHQPPQQSHHHQHSMASSLNTPRGFMPDTLPQHQLQVAAPDLHASSEANLENQQHFRERALSQAYRCYLQLLSYLQTAKRAQYSREGSGFDSTKHLSFPKPPRPKRENAYISPAATHINFGPIPSLQDGSTLFGHGGSFSQPTGQSFNNSHMYPQQQNQAHGLQNLYAGVDQFRPQAPRSYPHAFAAKPNSHQPNEASLISSARSSLELVKNLCEQAPWAWTDGMLLVGCLHYALEEYAAALQWFSRIVTEEPGHVEAVANIAATLYCLDRHDEAEKHWLRALKLRPSYMEAAEHLVGLLYKKRSREAIEVILFIQRSLRLEGPKQAANLHAATGNTSQADANAMAAAKSGVFGSSGYALPSDDNGRILALVHAKGTMLYGLKDIQGAADAFEEAVLIGTGRSIKGIRDLVARIRSALIRVGPSTTQETNSAYHLQPLLLTPDKARHTARLVFGGDGGLPGLAAIAEPAQKRAALQTTSNALLSLAKIFQDTMAAGNSDTGLSRPPTGVGDILALYYLSLALQESPSTANNVGILLAGIQQTVKPPRGARPPTTTVQPSIPGVLPGSGLELALSYYNYGLRLDPKHVHLHTNLGSLLKDVGQLDLAIQMYERAVSCDGTFDIALTNLANAVKDKGRINDAIGYYKRAIQANPSFAEAVCGLFTALNSVCDWRGRGGVLLDDGRYDRWHVGEDGMLIDAQSTKREIGLTKRVVDIVHHQLSEASSWGKNALAEATRTHLVKALQPLLSDKSFDVEAELQEWAGKPWEGSRLVRLLERSTRVTLRKAYLAKTSGRGNQTQNAQRLRLPANVSVPSAPTVLPFHTFTCPLPAKDIRLISQRNAMRISCSTLRAPWLSDIVYQAPPAPKPHLNVGYVSSDFNNHPLAHL